MTNGDAMRGEIFTEIYDKIIHFKNYNAFTQPTGNALKCMINEMTEIMKQYATDKNGNQQSLMKLMSMPKLLLQKAHRKVRAKENSVAFKQ